MDTVINNIDNDSVLESGQGSVVVSNDQPGGNGPSAGDPIEQIHIDPVQFAPPIDDGDPTAGDLNDLSAHDMFKVQNHDEPGTSSANQAQNDKVGRLGEFCSIYHFIHFRQTADVKPVHIGEKRFRCEKCGKTVSKISGCVNLKDR